MNTGPEFFQGMERLSQEDSLENKFVRHRKWLASSGLTHALVLLLMLAGPIATWLSNDPYVPGDVNVRFYDPGGSGQGSGGGGGGSGGDRISAFIPDRRIPEPEVAPAPEPEPRQAPVAPRKPRALNYDDLEVPDLPDEMQQLFAGIFSPDAREFPGLSLTDSRDLGGLDTAPSAGTGGGIGGGDGTGVGTGEGWGVGEGRGGGFGGGDYSPGGWDIEPVLVFEPPDPPYPASAREKMVRGEVILRVLVKLDGSTQVVGVIKSLPYCVDVAKEHARNMRWKPALKEGKPVEALGIVTVSFDIFTQNAKS